MIYPFFRHGFSFGLSAVSRYLGRRRHHLLGKKTREVGEVKLSELRKKERSRLKIHWCAVCLLLQVVPSNTKQLPNNKKQKRKNIMVTVHFQSGNLFLGTFRICESFICNCVHYIISIMYLRRRRHRDGRKWPPTWHREPSRGKTRDYMS